MKNTCHVKKEGRLTTHNSTPQSRAKWQKDKLTRFSSPATVAGHKTFLPASLLLKSMLNTSELQVIPAIN